jgi:hypothetical protein
MAQSPMHYIHALTAEDDPSYDMERGSGIHAVMFSTHQVIGYPGKVRNGKEWDAFKEKHAGAKILTMREYDKVCRMAESLYGHAGAMSLLFPKDPALQAGTRHEKTLYFKYMGRDARATPDSLNPVALAELKSSKTSEPERFMRHAQRMHYHAQLAFYREAVRICGLGTPRESYVVAVESSAPHPVTVLRLTDRTLEQGERACRLWFERLRACEEAGAWPPYVQSVVDWDIEEELELEYADDGDGDEFAERVA